MSDLLGILCVDGCGYFLAIEVKSERGVVSDAQRNFLAMVTKFGGCAFVARSAADATTQVDAFIASRRS